MGLRPAAPAGKGPDGLALVLQSDEGRTDKPGFLPHSSDEYSSAGAAASSIIGLPIAAPGSPGDIDFQAVAAHIAERVSQPDASGEPAWNSTGRLGPPDVLMLGARGTCSISKDNALLSR